MIYFDNGYLIETNTIDYGKSLIHGKVEELKLNSASTLDYIEKAYVFVRDDIYLF